MPSRWRLPRRVGWADAAVAVFVFALIYGVVRLGTQMSAPLPPTGAATLSLSPVNLPYYAARSVYRMFLAFAAALLFALTYGYAAAKSKSAERIFIPLLDVLQSVPVLGFLSATVTAFMGLFPGKLTGLELASIFAIFTGQAWNMAFSFYHSLITLPADLSEAASVYRLNWWQRFLHLEVPYATISLVWNGMMSFGGGWFFLAASEAITVLNRNVRLPGIGSYLAVALEERNLPAVGYAILTMVFVIVVIDQLFWRPVVAWAQRFKMELTQASVEPSSAVYKLLRRSALAGWIGRYVLNPPLHALSKGINSIANRGRPALTRTEEARVVISGLRRLAVIILVLWATRYGWMGVRFIAQMSDATIVSVVGYGILTGIRVLAAVLLGAVWTVPAGVAIGLSPRLSRVAQPLVLIAASFPANMVFPFITILYLSLHIGLGLGAVPLMMLGTQWYILFNVIAGAMALPTDLKEAASIFKLRGWSRWRQLLLPGIFPFLVTGCVTAAGGAWNASIVAEVVVWGQQTMAARGLGAYISEATATGNWPGIVWGIMVMSALVIALNRLVWRRLYALAQTRYRIS